MNLYCIIDFFSPRMHSAYFELSQGTLNFGIASIKIQCLFSEEKTLSVTPGDGDIALIFFVKICKRL